MDDPKTIPSDSPQPPSGSVPVATPMTVPLTPGGKELEGGSLVMNSSELPLVDMGKEIELSKEISAAGVKQQPMHIPVPPPVISMGVKQTASTIPVSTGATIVLPLSQTQIAEGLQKNITSSWRWLAEWCIKRLKQIRLLHTV